MRIFKLKKCKRIHGLHFAPQGGRLLVVGASIVEVVESAIWLDVATGTVVSRIDLSAFRYAVPPDVSRLAVLGANGYDDGIAPVQWTPLAGGEPDWHAVKGSEKLATEDGGLNGIAFDPSGQVVAVGHDVGSGDSRLTLLRLDTGRGVGERAFAKFPGVLAFDAAGNRLAVSGGPEGGSPEVSVFRLPALKTLFSYKPPGTRTRCLLFLPDGRLVAANARNVYVFPPGGGEPQFVLGGHTGQVNAVAVSPDGKRLLTASHDGAIRVWDAAAGKETATFDWKIGPVTAVAFAPDGLTAAVAGDKGQVAVWDSDE